MSTQIHAIICYGIRFEDYPENLPDEEGQISYLPVRSLNTDGGIILTVEASEIHCTDGWPTVFDPMKLFEIDTIPWNKILVDFCMKYEIEIPGAPAWYLSSYWG